MTGRPNKLNQVIRRDDQGQPVTASQEVIQRILVGADLDEASDSAGITRQTLHTWRKQGGLARAKEAGGGKLTPKERELVAFLDDYEMAQAQAEIVRLSILHRAAEGGFVTVDRHEKWVIDDSLPALPDGTPRLKLIERTVVTKTLAPQWQAAAWWLERRRRVRYARRMELTGADGRDLVPAPAEAQSEQVDDLLDQLDAFTAGAAAAMEAKAHG